MRAKRHDSITWKLTIFLSIILALQCFLFAGFVLLGGTLDRLEQNAMDILSERTLNRKNYLESEMVQRWSNLDQYQGTVSQTVKRFLLENDMTTRDLKPNDPQTVQLLEQLSDQLISLMRRNSVTGAFVIFNGDEPLEQPAPGEQRYLTGLYYRDMDPVSTPADNSDLMVERGSSELLRTLNIPMDINWSPAFIMTEADSIYYAPLAAALDDPTLSLQDLGYWCGNFSLYGDEVSIVTYTQPLMDAEGRPYGVLGIELTADHLRTLMPSSELDPNKSASYLLVCKESGDGGIFEGVVANGPAVKHLFGESNTYDFGDQPIYGDIYEAHPTEDRGQGKVYASIQPFKLYNSNTPFSGQEWALVGLTDGTSLFAFSQSVSRGILTLTLISLVLGTVLSCLASSLYTRPIRTLARTVRKIDPAEPVALPAVDIGEIDELSSAIESLSRDVAETSSQMSQIIELAGIPLAAYKLDPSMVHPYYTKGFFPMLGLEEPEAPISTESFLALLDSLQEDAEEQGGDGDTTMYKRVIDGSPRWLRVKTVHSGAATLGVLVDATEEIVEKRRIEYERDYDPLTNLLNRRSFRHRLNRLSSRPERLKTGAMVMLDLDNLKYLNDTYGHDCGDEYIRCAADVLRSFTPYGGLASRISGDEFYLFFSGYEDRAGLQHTLDLLRQRIDAARILLPDGQIHRLRASVGVAWYPDDSAALPELLRFADFAMYEAKNAMKGTVKNFDIHTYRRDSFLLYSLDELDRILDERAIDYAFQPILSSRTGDVVGYEALMRPRSKILSSPLDILRMARAQSKLADVERLTWFRALEVFQTLPDKPEGCLIFVNSIASQRLSPADLEAFDAAYGGLLPQIVLELTEDEEMDVEATRIKKQRSERLHMHMAIDDFGTGYSNDSVLLSVEPDFVKVDIAIVRGIDQDKTRQAMFRNLVSLCHSMRALVVAEGVETQEELFTVIHLGADLIQGYFTGRPSPIATHPSPELRRLLQTAWEQRLDQTD